MLVFGGIKQVAILSSDRLGIQSGNLESLCIE